MTAIEVVAVKGAALVQDLGRRGFMHHGVPRGGAMVPEWLAFANRRVGNVDGAAAIELFAKITVRAVGGSVVLGSLTSLTMLDEHAVMEVSPASSVGYLAVRGGLQVGDVLGGRGTLVVAGLGGWHGRFLRRGDAMSVGGEATSQRGVALGTPPLFTGDAPLRVVLGPDEDSFSDEARRTLLEASFTVSAVSDRTGTRLDGPHIARRGDDSATSLPMVRGAIQVPASGQPIVLGPDHPTTGGYPVIATLIGADHGRLAASVPGTRASFRAVTVAEARAAWAVNGATSGKGDGSAP